MTYLERIHNFPPVLVRTTLGYCHAEAKSVPDPIARLRQTMVPVVSFQEERVKLLA